MDSQFAPEEDMDNTVDSYSVTINGFIFCTRHGLEVCDKCPTDNRGANNMIVEESLHEKLSEEEYSSWPGDDRPPFTVTHQWARVSGGKPGCIKHKEVGCKECFDWEEKLYRGIHGGRKPRHTRSHMRGKRHSHDASDEALH
ncbi:hypothetical protein [Absidia glauca]|uniref:Uncharacterized protein n=1 Tax=Absidia glauca TaxID=4829 RepID=A0A168R4J5_ABSGL|nr:hypothetical protein [Absidia glauca]